MKDYLITWNDGETSTESFNNELELIDYLSAVEQDTGLVAEKYELI